MPVIDILELPHAVAPYTPVVGLDLGEKTVGVAVSDLNRSIASPLELIRKTKFTEEAQTLFRLMGGRGAKGIVIGLPLNMDGSEGPRCQSVRAYARNLLKLDESLPIAFWDERLSTAAVQRMMTREGDITRARRAELVDKTAAAYILQGALDRLRSAGF
jgi:putative Holliday junction resolvase